MRSNESTKFRLGNFIHMADGWGYIDFFKLVSIESDSSSLAMGSKSRV
jgi:hypothetical protein